MKRYRLYTENKNASEVEQEVSKYFKSFNVSYPTGFWKGERENSLVIEVINDGVNTFSGLGIIATWIKIHNKQQNVLITTENIEADLI